MYAKPAFLHTSPSKSPNMYAKPPFLHTSPSKQSDLYAKSPFLHTKRQPLHAQGLASWDSKGVSSRTRLQQPEVATAAGRPSRK